MEAIQMKQVTLEFHPASERPKENVGLLLCSDEYTFAFDGSYNRLGGYSCLGIPEDGVEALAYLPKAEECVNK
jgi:hypothetical protein